MEPGKRPPRSHVLRRTFISDTQQPTCNIRDAACRWAFVRAPTHDLLLADSARGVMHSLYRKVHRAEQKSTDVIFKIRERAAARGEREGFLKERACTGCVSLCLQAKIRIQDGQVAALTPRLTSETKQCCARWNNAARYA